MLYRYKVAIFAGVVGGFTLLLAYITGPKGRQVPAIRVLVISHSDHGMVKRISSSAQAVDEFVQVLKVSEDGSVTVRRDEWDLKSTREEFYQSNLVLECEASFPVSWRYEGFGEPTVREENVRIQPNFNDSTTFTYLSLLNLMPLGESSTGDYVCYGASNETFTFFSGVHLFVPGEATFLIDYDTTVEAAGEERIFVPCPVSDPLASVALYFKNQPIASDNVQDLVEFDPKTGFYLKPRFVEEQSDPWGQFYCKAEEGREKSGVITVVPVKGLIVNVSPETSTVLLSKPAANKNSLEETFKFVCNAKEEIVLKFLRVVTFPMVEYSYNSSSSFPYSAVTEVSSRNFRNLSRIYCRTVKGSEDLHSWRVLFSSLPLRTELMDFNYHPEKEEFACCSPSNKRAKLTHIPCNSISQCRVRGNCLGPGRKCSADEVSRLPERSGCARHKLVKGGGKEGGSSRGRYSDDEGWEIESGFLQCVVEGKRVEMIYFASWGGAGNGTRLETISDLLKDETGGSSPPPFMNLSFAQSSLQIMQVREARTTDLSRKKRFVCRGAKFFLAIGFLWQILRANGQVDFYTGRDLVKGPWIESELRLPSHSPNASQSLKRLYCMAPLWASREEGAWAHAKLEWGY